VARHIPTRPHCLPPLFRALTPFPALSARPLRLTGLPTPPPPRAQLKRGDTDAGMSAFARAHKLDPALTPPPSNPAAPPPPGPTSPARPARPAPPVAAASSKSPPAGVFLANGDTEVALAAAAAALAVMAAAAAAWSYARRR
jgi:hypothetical protein